MVTVINYGMGNIGSILNMLKRVGVEPHIATNVEEIETAEKIILPGVGSFDAAMSTISKLNFFDVLNYKALEEKVPILGICLGMQLLTNRSDEGSKKGFGWINADTVKFEVNSDSNMKIPHMGWNSVSVANESPLTDDLPVDARFYFVHSYYVKVADQGNSLLKTKYGVEFDSAIRKDNIFGAQFHPEKSHKFGMCVFENFAKI